jgi:prolyl-tRNA synthetase
VLVPLSYDKSDQVRSSADALYDSLRAHGVAVLLDDRAARPGVKFADAELIGIPQRVVIGERSLAKGCLEFQRRQDSEASSVELDNIVEVLLAGRADAADISA